MSAFTSSVLRYAVTFWLFWLAAAAQAHDTGQSYVFLSFGGDTIDVRVEMGAADVNRALGLGLPDDSTLTLDQVTQHAEALRRYVLGRLQLAPDGVVATLEPAGLDLMPTSRVQFIQTGFRITGLATQPEYIDIRYDLLFDAVPDHEAFAVVENNWQSATFDNEAVISLVFSRGNQSARLDLSDASPLVGTLGMIEMGTRHIWAGIDHVLFLIALLLPSVMRRRDGRWEPVPDLKTALIQVVKIVTVFTVAHTVTLSLAALEIVSLPSRLVESIIAVSIAIVAIDILVPMFRNWTYTVVLAFGLFHGFGFASVLGEMPIPTAYMVLSLLGFNIGVELGQVVIVLAVVPVLYALRNFRVYARWTMPAGAMALIAISLYWFIERAFDVDLPAGAIVNQLLGLA